LATKAMTKRKGVAARRDGNFLIRIGAFGLAVPEAITLITKSGQDPELIAKYRQLEERLIKP
jgi:hypothetical protein